MPIATTRDQTKQCYSASIKKFVITVSNARMCTRVFKLTEAFAVNNKEHTHKILTFNSGVCEHIGCCMQFFLKFSVDICCVYMRTLALPSPEVSCPEWIPLELAWYYLTHISHRHLLHLHQSSPNKKHSSIHTNNIRTIPILLDPNISNFPQTTTILAVVTNIPLIFFTHNGIPLTM